MFIHFPCFLSLRHKTFFFFDLKRILSRFQYRKLGSMYVVYRRDNLNIRRDVLHASSTHVLCHFFSGYSIWSMVSFTSALCICILVYQSLVQTDFNGPDGKHSPHLLRRWWFYGPIFIIFFATLENVFHICNNFLFDATAKYSMVAALLCISIGILTFFFGMQKTFMLKFPSPACNDISYNDCLWDYKILGYRNSWGSSQNMTCKFKIIKCFTCSH